MDVVALKEAAQREVDRVAGLLIEASDWMADNPELGHQEHRAAARLTALLDEFGATVEHGIAGLPTAFAATLPGGGAGPKVAIVAEYDALPDVGHGCGHNIIATAAIGAGIALARLGAAARLPGAVVVLGTPAEESAVPDAGGKIPVLDGGYFDGVDAALMVHPMTEDSIALTSSLVAHGLDFAFHGRPAHAAANPHEGINALDALIAMFTSVGLLRQQVRPDARIHGVITYGGGAPNVIPPYTSCRFRVRATDPAYCRELVDRVVACAEGGARATGARLEWREYMPPYLNMVPNHTLGAVLRSNLEALGRDVRDERLRDGSGSTDFGNVSHRVPAVYAYLGICGPEAGWHSKEVAAATKTERGHAAILAGAKSLAMTALDLLADGALRDEAKREHRQALAKYG
jgi:amidohydrolase